MGLLRFGRWVDGAAGLVNDHVTARLKCQGKLHRKLHRIGRRMGSKLDFWLPLSH
jgi:hypothetical protein